MKRWLPLLFALLGFGVIVALVLREGASDIVTLLGKAGWPLLLLIPFHALPLILDAEGWRALLTRTDPQRLATRPLLFWIATVREAMNRLLPVASVGGEIVGIRLVLLKPLTGAAVSASVVVEILLTIVNQYLFTALGLGLVLIGANDPNLALELLLGLAATLPWPFALYWVLRYGKMFGRLEKILIGMLGDASRAAALFGDAGRLDHEIRLLFAQRGALFAGLVWQLAGMIVASFEVWFVLHLLGHTVSPGAAIAIESLTLAVRHFAFFVPGGLGVQEASLVLFGNLAGLPAEVSVTLSLAKRFREIGFGVPALLSWQWIEGRLWLRRASSDGNASSNQKI